MLLRHCIYDVSSGATLRNEPTRLTNKSILTDDDDDDDDDDDTIRCPSLTRQRPRERSRTRPESRSFPPSVIAYLSRTEGVTSPENGQEEEESFFERPPPPPPPLPPPTLTTSQQQTQTQIEQTAGGLTKPEDVDGKIEIRDSANERETSEELERFAQQNEDRSTIDGQIRRPHQVTRDHYTSRKTSWSRSKYGGPLREDKRMQQDDGVTLRREMTGGTRISPSTIDRVFDNSNRRQYGMGIVGRFFGRSFRKSITNKPEVRKQLDDFEDHRPYFTYWITTVQVLILIISLACYGFGPVGMELNHRSARVLVTSLSLQEVDYQEPANFWLGPRAADLIHLGAKFAPCMRRDIKILKEIDIWRERERDTACCIRNDDSGCVQSSKADCSNTISTWKKWGPGDSGPGGRISGSVCGLDPKFCDAPASIAPYEWPDDITKWPICRKTNPFSQRYNKNLNQRGNGNFPIGRYKDKMAEHMVCEVIGHPCCIGIHGMCRITTKEYCDFVGGYFHEEASLCSQVECLHDVCGMIPFLHPEWPDQFYRLFTTTFLHAGILHLAITLLIQYFLMRDLEKLTGSLRIALIYFVGALAGNLASAIFVPYRAEVGPAGAHFALLATLVVEVLHCWPMLKHPRRALSKLICILLGLLILGVLPWIDNYAHLFGFIFGFLAAYAFMPFISFGHYDRRLRGLQALQLYTLYARLLRLAKYQHQEGGARMTHGAAVQSRARSTVRPPILRSFSSYNINNNNNNNNNNSNNNNNNNNSNNKPRILDPTDSLSLFGYNPLESSGESLKVCTSFFRLTQHGVAVSRMMYLRHTGTICDGPHDRLRRYF
uniref:Peptidase S54 rhomboid domain-containing protein n=1 Tax=Vespula pensylvanica TaxID=30213 RepID=A0A834PE24_VESPE|nr:hypothetical protein H0235_000326 [Vespula pensylvanica]